MKNYSSSEINTVEWNSNKLVIERLNKVIDRVNIFKSERNVEHTINSLRDLYMEICADLTPEEDKIWDKIKFLIQINSPDGNNIVLGFVINEGVLWAEIDELERKLRKLAKVHGYLASNKDDLSGL